MEFIYELEKDVKDIEKDTLNIYKHIEKGGICIIRMETKRLSQSTEGI